MKLPLQFGALSDSDEVCAQNSSSAITLSVDPVQCVREM